MWDFAKDHPFVFLFAIWIIVSSATMMIRGYERGCTEIGIRIVGE